MYMHGCVDACIAVASLASVVAGLGYWRRTRWSRWLGALSLAFLWAIVVVAGWGREWLPLAVVAMIGPTLASILGDESALVFSASIAGGGVGAVIHSSSPLLFILWLEASIITSYAAIALGKGGEEYRAALVYFIASSAAVVLMAVALFSPSYGQASMLLLLLGGLLELSIAPLHLWGIEVTYTAPLAPLLAGFTAPKIPVIYIILQLLSRLGPQSQTAIVAYIAAAASILVGGLVGASRPMKPRKSLAYGSVMHMALPLYLIARPESSLLAYYLACYVLGEAGLVALVYSMEQGWEPSSKPYQQVLAALLLAGLVGLPPAASFPAKLGVVVSAFRHTWIGALAAASLLIATPGATLYYTRAVLESYSYVRRGPLIVLAASSFSLLLLLLIAPLG